MAHRDRMDLEGQRRGEGLMLYLKNIEISTLMIRLKMKMIFSSLGFSATMHLKVLLDSGINFMHKSLFANVRPSGFAA